PEANRADPRPTSSPQARPNVQDNLLMISVAAIRMQQFGVQFYQASLTASDIDKLVRFEVLSYGEQAQPVRGGRRKAPPTPSKVNWDLLERRIASSEKAYQ